MKLSNILGHSKQVYLYLPFFLVFSLSGGVNAFAWAGSIDSPINFNLEFPFEEAEDFEFKPSKIKPGKKLKLIAEPNQGFRFVSWTLDGRVLSIHPTFDFIMPARDVVLRANYAPISNPPSETMETLPEANSPVRPSAMLDGLVSYYEMNDNASGLLRDSRGGIHGRNFSITNVSGFTGNGNRYNGFQSISNVAHHNNHNFNTQFTIMVDIFRTGSGQNSTSIIVGKTFSNSWPENQSYSLGLTRDNRIRIRTNTQALNDWVSTQTVPENTWTRIIATYKSGEGYRLYMNRIEVERSQIFSGRIHQSNRELTIGAATTLNNASAGRRFNGIIDNVALWNRQLRFEEIRMLMTQRLSYTDLLADNAALRADNADVVDTLLENEELLNLQEKLISNNTEQDVQDVRINFSLAPNPVSDNLNVILQNLDGRYSYEIQIVSMLGNVAKTFQAHPEGSVISLDISDLNQGVYLLHLIGEGNSLSSKKFIKK